MTRKPKLNNRLRRFVVETLERRDTPSAFTPGNLVVYRVDGTVWSPAGVAPSGNPVFLDEFLPTGTGQTPVQSIALPTTGPGAIIAGSGTLEGGINLSPDSQFLTVTGYNTDLPAGASTVPLTSSAADRAVAVADKSGTVTIHNRLTDLSGNALRGSITVDGNSIWVTGTTGNNFRYIANNGDTTSTLLTSAPATPRWLTIAGGQLYGSAASAAFRVFTVGTGLPTVGGQTSTNLPGSGITALQSPNAIFFVDLSPSIPGVDTLYVGDNSSNANGGGVRKFSFDGTNWLANGAITIATGGNPIGLIGSASGGNVTIFGTNATTLFTLTDTSGYNATITGTVSNLATTTATNPFRGVAYAPRDATSATVNSLNADVGSTTGPTVTYTETFSAAVTGVTAGNFTLTTTGTAVGTIGTPSTSNGGLTWSIPVNGISGLGTVRLNAANTTGTSIPVTNVPFNGQVVNVTTTNSVLDVSSKQAIFSAGLGKLNNVTLSVSGGTYTINDSLQPISLTAAAITAGWTGNNTNTVTGPDSATDSLLVALGSGADSFTLNSVNDPLTVTSNTDAGSNANFGANISLAGAISVSGFDSITETGGVLLTVSDVTLGGNSVGTGITPIHTKSTNVTATAGDGGMFLTEDDGANFTLTTTGVGTMTVTNTTGTLTVSGASTFGSGAVTLSSGDGVAINAALGDLVSSGTVSIAANTDGVGSQGFSMSSSGTVRTLDASAVAFTLLVNTPGGGNGDALMNNVQVGSTGSVNIDANAGSILGTATNVIFAGGGFGFLGAVTLKTSGAASAVGTSAQHLILRTGNIDADAGSGGIFLEEASTSHIKVGHLTAQGAGDILLKCDPGSGDIDINGMVTTGSGKITMSSDDNFFILATGNIGDSNFSGKVEINVNTDGQNQQVFQQAAGTLIQTTSTAIDAVTINDSASTNATAIGGARLGNITVGNGGGITVNVAKLIGLFDVDRAGFIEMIDAFSSLNAGPTGSVMLIARDNYIGKLSTPIMVTAGTVSAITNSTTSTTNAGQIQADIFVTSTGAANFSATTTDAGTRIGTIIFTTQSGGITLNGDLKTDTGDITLNSAAGIDQSGGKVTSLGNVNYNYLGQARFSTPGNSITTLNLTPGQNLRDDGTVTLANPISIDGTLSGSGTLTAVVNVTSSGKVTPGTSPGKLGTGNIAFVSGSQFVVELNGNTAGTNYDQLAVVGTVDVSGAKLVGSVGGIIAPGSTLTIIDNDGTLDPVTGQFVDGTNTPIPEGGSITIGATTFTVSYKGGDGNDVTLKAPGVSNPPPTVTNVVINGANGAGNQRSMVESVVVTFSEAVNFTGAAFQLARTATAANNPGGLLGNVNLTVVESSPSATVTLKFATGGTVGVDPAGTGKFSLLDGQYQLTIFASGITGTGGNMAANFQTPTSGASRIFRLYGDADGNGIVDGLDFGAFRTAFNTNSFTFDKDGSGVVDGLDFGQFRNEFNNSVP